jgi:hypothetical protein
LAKGLFCANNGPPPELGEDEDNPPPVVAEGDEGDVDEDKDDCGNDVDSVDEDVKVDEDVDVNEDADVNDDDDDDEVEVEAGAEVDDNDGADEDGLEDVLGSFKEEVWVVSRFFNFLTSFSIFSFTITGNLNVLCCALNTIPETLTTTLSPSKSTKTISLLLFVRDCNSESMRSLGTPKMYGSVVEIAHCESAGGSKGRQVCVQLNG